MNRHVLERQSKHGDSFVGYCIYCLKEDLTLEDFFEQECPIEVPFEDTLLRIIE